jgi:hypothetical protein
VTVEAGGARQSAEVRAAAGYLGSNDARVHFGLGDVGKIDRVVVQWPEGNRDELREPSVDRELVFREGEGLVPR